MMKFIATVLILFLVLNTMELNLVKAISEFDEQTRSISDVANKNSFSMEKVRFNRKAHCGIRTFKILMLICSNDLKISEQKNDQETDDQLFYEEPTRYLQPNDDFLNQQLNQLTKYQKIPDLRVYNNPSYHRMKRNLIRDCCHRSCSIKELKNLC